MSSHTTPLPPFDVHDPAGIDDLLTQEEKDVRASVRQLVEQVASPYVADWFETGAIDDPRALVKSFGELGLLGMHLEGYGCAGMSAVDYGLACVELEACDSGIRSMVSVQGSLAMYAIWQWGSEEQKQEWLPRMAAGDAIGCFGLTEPDHGSDPGGMRTRARRDGADWVLDGRKMWITNGSIADVAVVWAQTDEGDPRLRRPDRHRRLLRPGDQAQDVAARLGHQRAGARRRPAPRLRGAARRTRAQGPALLPERGALRHRLGRARRGPVLPRGGAVVRRRADAVRQADRGLPADPGQARRHDARAGQGAAARAAPRAAQGRRHRCAPSRSASASSTTSARPSRSAGPPAPSSAPTASRWSTPSSGTPTTSSPCSPTRAPSRCTPWSSARR